MPAGELHARADADAHVSSDAHAVADRAGTDRSRTDRARSNCARAYSPRADFMARAYPADTPGAPRADGGRRRALGSVLVAPVEVFR